MKYFFKFAIIQRSQFFADLCPAADENLFDQVITN